MNKNTVQIELSWKIFWQIFIFAAFFLIIYLAQGALSALLIAMVISIGLDPVVSLLERAKIGRLVGTVLIFLSVIFLLSFTGYAIAPIVIGELTNFLEEINHIQSSITGISIPQAVIKDVSGNVEQALSFLTTARISTITGAIGTVVSKFILFLATVIISFYLTAEKEGTSHLIKVMMPDSYEKSVLTVFNRFKAKIRRWFGAQLGLSLVVGIIVTIGLWILGVRHFLILGLLAAIFEIVPIIGPILAAGVTFLVAVGGSLSLGLYSLLFFFVVQQLENHVLIPFIMGKSMNVHPVMVVISMLAGSQVAGFIGVVLAVPIAVLAQEIFTYLAEERESRLSSS